VEGENVVFIAMWKTIRRRISASYKASGQQQAIPVPKYWDLHKIAMVMLYQGSWERTHRYMADRPPQTPLIRNSSNAANFILLFHA
jgi:hypothetical protein